MRTLHKNVFIDDLTGWVVSNGVSTKRMELEFGRHEYNVINVELFTSIGYESSEWS